MYTTFTFNTAYRSMDDFDTVLRKLIEKGQETTDEALFAAFRDGGGFTSDRKQMFFPEKYTIHGDNKGKMHSTEVMYEGKKYYAEVLWAEEYDNETDIEFTSPVTMLLLDPDTMKKNEFPEIKPTPITQETDVNDLPF